MKPTPGELAEQDFHDDQNNSDDSVPIHFVECDLDDLDGPDDVWYDEMDAVYHDLRCPEYPEY